VRALSMDDTIVWISPRAVMRASTSSIASGTTVPATAGMMVRIVLLRETAMLPSADSTCGATAVVTSDAIAPAGRLVVSTDVS
jgi:hypothetical protein